MCVLKSTVCDISVQVSSMLFDTLPFYTLVFSPLAYHPVGRPHSRFLKWLYGSRCLTTVAYATVFTFTLALNCAVARSNFWVMSFCLCSEVKVCVFNQSCLLLGINFTVSVINCQFLLSYYKTKTPGCLVLGSLEVCVYFGITRCLPGPRWPLVCDHY